MLKIGITGHRNLNKKSIALYKQQVFNKLLILQKRHNDIIVYSPLADGADRIIIEQAIKLNIDFIVVLPMKLEYYKNDFIFESKLEFTRLLLYAKDIIQIPLAMNTPCYKIEQYGLLRDLQYEKAGQFIADNCDILIALWDGIDTGLKGGTSEIVKYFCLKPYFRLYHLLVSRENNLKILTYNK